ncbi:GxxExxY protein [bacterium]|nr:GxxExxY protein [bacterium]
MYFFNGVKTIFEKMFKVIYNCIQWSKICFCHELSKRGLKYQRQVDIPIIYDGIIFNEGLRADVLVEKLIICELKAVDEIHPVKYFDRLCQQNLLLALFHGVNPLWGAQILSHLKLTDKRLGFLINFNVLLIKKGIKRYIL